MQRPSEFVVECLNICGHFRIYGIRARLVSRNTDWQLERDLNGAGLLHPRLRCYPLPIAALLAFVSHAATPTPE